MMLYGNERIAATLMARSIVDAPGNIALVLEMRECADIDEVYASIAMLFEDPSVERIGMCGVYPAHAD
jgi:hypothetical protein